MLCAYCNVWIGRNFGTTRLVVGELKSGVFLKLLLLEKLCMFIHLPDNLHVDTFILWSYQGGKKCGNCEAASREVLVFGGKFWNFVGNFVFLYIKTHNKLWENWPASREINIFFQSWILQYTFNFGNILNEMENYLG